MRHDCMNPSPITADNLVSPFLAAAAQGCHAVLTRQASRERHAFWIGSAIITAAGPLRELTLGLRAFVKLARSKPDDAWQMLHDEHDAALPATETNGEGRSQFWQSADVDRVQLQQFIDAAIKGRPANASPAAGSVWALGLSVAQGAASLTDCEAVGLFEFSDLAARERWTADRLLRDAMKALSLGDKRERVLGG